MLFNRMYPNGLLIVILATLAMLQTGCGQDANEKDAESKEKESAANNDNHDHSGWWCKEHGIPEEECSMCSATAAENFKEKSDWCEEHDRAESQCFKCDPSRAEKYAKLYEAKYGHAPPEPTE